MKLYRDLSEDYLRAHPLPSHENGNGKEARGRVLVVSGKRPRAWCGHFGGRGCLARRSRYSSNCDECVGCPQHRSGCARGYGLGIFGDFAGGD
jgi:hypothetical protein